MKKVLVSCFLSSLFVGAMSLAGGVAFAGSDDFGGSKGKGGPKLTLASEKSNKLVAKGNARKVPELDPNTAGAALALLVGGGLVVANRKRLVRA